MIGRLKEVHELEELYERKHPELVAVYGRRRIGKTYLVEQVFKNRFSFRHAGFMDGSPMRSSFPLFLLSSVSSS